MSRRALSSPRCLRPLARSPAGLQGGPIVKDSSITVDPGLEGVIVGSTGISKVAGQEGRLTYRGYDIADLASNASYEEVCYLLWSGRLPNQAELDVLRSDMAAQRALPQHVLAMMHGIDRKAWPMDVLRTVMSSLSLSVPVRADGTHVSDIATAIRLTASAGDRGRRVGPSAPRRRTDRPA